jgi:hypothetical protein
VDCGEGSMGVREIHHESCRDRGRAGGGTRGMRRGVGRWGGRSRLESCRRGSGRAKSWVDSWGRRLVVAFPILGIRAHLPTGVTVFFESIHEQVGVAFESGGIAESVARLTAIVMSVVTGGWLSITKELTWWR